MRRLLAVGLVVLPFSASADHVSATPEITLEVGDYDPAQLGHPAKVRWSVNCSANGADVQYLVGAELASEANDDPFSNVFTEHSGNAPAEGEQDLVLQPGVAVYPRLQQTGCSENPPDGNVHAHATDVRGEPTRVPPRVTPPLAFAPDAGFQSDDGRLVSGKEATVVPMVSAKPVGGESLTLVVRGAGMDYAEPFDPGASTQLQFTPQAGTIDMFVVMEPYGVESNHVFLQASADGSELPPEGRPAGGGSGSSGSSGGGSGGCAGAAGAAPGPGRRAALALLRRRR